jgi:peptidoglycan/xylan/chitin deacetylase (PgdA/CDA1 family)
MSLSQLKRWFMPHASAALPPRQWHGLVADSLLVPYYHIVADHDVPHVKHLYRFRTVAEFKQDLEFFLAHYVPVGLSAVIEHLEGKRVLPKRCYLLTFDDGFREMHDVVAPILKAKGVPATFFLTTGFIDNVDMAHHCKFSLLVEHLSNAPRASVVEEVENILARNGVEGNSFESKMVTVRYCQSHLVTKIAALCEYDFAQYLSSYKPYLTSDQIRSLLKQGFTIGAHSIDHPLYADLALEEQVRQTVCSIRFLVQHFELNYRAFAFPHSDAGVREEFFKEMRDTWQLQVSFGTAGMRRHFFPRNLERFSMENSSLPATQIIRMNYLRGLLSRMFA